MRGFFALLSWLLIAAAASAQLAVNVGDERIAIVRQGDKTPILEQIAKPDFRPYIHPIAAPDGKGVFTEFSPGHHKHQTGLYVGHTRINGKDYFHNPGANFFTRKSLAGSAKGNQAAWTVVYDLNGAAGPVLRETQAWTLTDLETSYLLDLDWRGEALVDVTVGKYSYGGVFVRMPHKGQGAAVNSEGLKNGQAEQKRSKWVDIGLPIEGRDKDDWAHIAILDHKSNPAHPSPWRVDGQLGVSPTRAILGDWTIPKGETAAAKYRFVIYAGPLDAKRIDAAFESWK